MNGAAARDSAARNRDSSMRCPVARFALRSGLR